MQALWKSGNNKLSFPILALLLLVLVAFSGCVAGQAAPRQSAAKENPLAATGAQQTPAKAAEQKGTPVAEPSPGVDVAPKATKAPAGKSAVAEMLLGAGRNPDAAQPESTFLLEVPDHLWAGDPFAVTFGASGLQKLVIQWRGKTLSLTPSANDPVCRAILAVPLGEKAAAIPLLLQAHWADGRKEEFRAKMPILTHDYPVQSLKVQQKFVTPPPEVQEKIKKDRAELRAAISPVTPERYWTLPMHRPVPGVVTSLYGLRRVFNGEERNPHKGVDFDAKEGDPIASMDKGVVVLVSDHYYSGNIVAVDHGLGVYSLYLHLSAFNVQKGQKVERGDTIGLIGSTGRVTGPHLHLSFAVLGDMVNAAACIGGMQ